ncbi:MAG TPA: OmpA family protein [Candidatus Acidoferrales bacterium]|nr:OmpA family protein [Candidatus Acidoferrales bacterium]
MLSKNTFLAIAVALASSWSAGCVATRGFVRSNVQPVSTKLNQVAQQTDQQGTELKQTGAKLDQTNQTVQQNTTDISATKEIATGADSRSTDALNKATENGKNLSELHDVVANLDDYKVADQAAVHFGFNKDKLTADDKDQLDKVAGELQNLPRYFITIEGFTDQTGPATYNESLSQRRADHVVEYLVGEKSIPLYRIHVIGLGEQKLVNDGKTRQDRAESRRVEVSLYSAPALPAPTGTAK